jgi:hypothetical protein
MRLGPLGASLAGALVLALATAGRAQHSENVADFYKNRDLFMEIGYSPGRRL